MIDCGANHGFTTALFAKWTGSKGRVFAYEPSSHNVEILQSNLKLNSVENVTCRIVAVGSASGTVDITTHPNAAVIRERKEGQRSEIVPIIKLDDEVFPGRVAFIKVDVEGFELEVLKGAQRILSTKPRLTLELHVFMYHDKVGTLRKIFDLLCLDQYTVDIQPEVDGAIDRLDTWPDVLEYLANREVVHLFCR